MSVLKSMSGPLGFLDLATRITCLSCCLWLPAAAQILEQAKLSGSDAIGKAAIGQSVGISADGNTIIAGGPHDSGAFGAAWIFSRNGIWSQQGSKQLGLNVLGTNAPLQGWSVAISGDGNTAFAGAIGDDAECGSTYYFARNGGAWSWQGKLALGCALAGQGTSVALSADGNTALVGAVGYSDLAGEGSVVVYKRTNGAWSMEAELDAEGGIALGSSLALTPDGNTALVGDPTDNGVGAAYVFVRNGGVWSQQGRLSATGGVGSFVAISEDGNTALLGAPAANGGVGGAWVFTRTGNVWSTQPSLLTGQGSTGIANQGPVAISADGNTAVLGGAGDNSGAGAAWVFIRAGGQWMQYGDKLFGGDAAGKAAFGSSVAISGDASTVVVGGPADASGAGAAWVFTVPHNNAASSFTISQPSTGLQLFVDGLSYEAEGDSTHTFPCAPGSQHSFSLDISGLPSAFNSREVFAGWTDGVLSASRQITCSASPTTYTDIINSQFRLTTAVAPAGVGSISANPASPDGFYNVGTSVQLTASGGFMSWSGDLSGSANPQSLTMNAPHSVTANFIAGAPAVWIDTPVNGATVSGPVSVTGWAIDNASGAGTAISGVQVKVDGVFAGNATYGVSRSDVCNVFPGRPKCPNVGYTFQLNTSSLSPGPHAITVSATDSDPTPDTSAISVTVTVSAATAPTVFIDSPGNGSTVSGAVSISGWAIDNTSTIGTAIASVQVKVDGTAVGFATYGVSRKDVCAAYPGRPGCPNVGFNYLLNTAGLASGPHTLTVSATDSDSSPQTGSSTVNITVSNAAPPLVFIDTPSSGATLSGTVSMTGWALDNGVSAGTAIASVQIKVDGIAVGNATYGFSRGDVCAAYPNRPNCPNVGWAFSLDTTKLAAGPHTLTAVATDTDANPDAGSWTEAITVAPLSSPPPLVFIDNPATGAVVSGTVTVWGWAVDNGVTVGTTISSVQLKVDGQVVGSAHYGTPRTDVCAVYLNRPGCPNVGWELVLDTTRLAAGLHTLTAVATDMDGSPDSGSFTVTMQVGTH